MSFKRARDEQQIEQRKQDILSQAKKLCDEMGVMQWSLNELGRRASVNKSNLYRYFGSREEILMQLMQNEMHHFIDQTLAKLKDKKFSLEDFAEMLAKQFASQDFLCQLISLSTSILEENVSVERIKAFKLETRDLNFALGQQISQSLDGVSIEQAMQITMTSGVMVAGLWPMANRGAKLQELTKDEDFAWLKLDFESQLSDTLKYYLQGLLSSR